MGYQNHGISLRFRVREVWEIKGFCTTRGGGFLILLVNFYLRAIQWHGFCFGGRKWPFGSIRTVLFNGVVEMC